LETAAARFQEALRWNRFDHRAYVGLANVYIERGAYESAVVALDSALGLNWNDAVSHFKLGQLYETLGKRDQALAEWTTAKAANYFQLLGDRNRVARRYVEAKTANEIALLLEPKCLECLYNMGDLYWELQKPQLGIPYYIQAVDADRDPRRPFRKFTRLGRTHFAQGNWAACIQAYEAAIAYAESGPDPARFPEQGSIEPYQMLAQVYYSGKHDPDAATNVLARGVAANPSNQWLYLLVGDIYKSTKQYSEAMTWYQKAKGAAPNSGMSELRSAILAFDQGDLPQALGYVRAAEEKSPKDSEIVAWYGRIYRRMNSYPDAIQYFQRALALDPQRIGLYEELGEVYFEAKEYGLAKATFRSVLDKFPDDEYAKSKLAALEMLGLEAP